MTDYNKDKCSCYKELLRQLQLRNIVQFLKEPSIRIAQKLYIRELWAMDMIDCASDWICIYRGLPSVYDLPMI